MTIEQRPRLADRPSRVPNRLAAACLVLAACLVVAACSGRQSTVSDGTLPPGAGGPYPGWPGSGAIVADPDFTAVLVSTEVGVGVNRLLATVYDRDGRSIASPELAIDLGFYDLAAGVDDPVGVVPGTFRWQIPDERGIYTASFDFPHAGDWGVEATGHESGMPDRKSRVTFSVRETTQAPAIGSRAPASDTPTASDPAQLRAISTDPDPDPALYRVSIRAALGAGEPFVVVFATPAFCASGTCGPALDLIKGIVPAYDGRVAFIHVEPYLLRLVDGQLQPELDDLGQLQPVAATLEWNLPSEPYIFVVDGSGAVVAKFEGMAYPDELSAALDEVLGRAD